MDVRQLTRMRRQRRGFRFMGVMWALFGGIMTISFIPIALDPNATFNYNGVPTAAVGAKLWALVFVAFFFIAGVCLMLLPVRMLNRLILWEQSAWSFLAFWKR
jgi:hypothetical protein